MQTRTFSFKADAGEKASITVKNTLLGDIRFLDLMNRFVKESQPDKGFRADFCWVVSFVDSVEGIDWDLDWRDTPSPEQFEACYRGLARHFERDTFHELVTVVNKLKNRDDPIEKPDAALTDEDKADPN